LVRRLSRIGWVIGGAIALLLSFASPAMAQAPSEGAVAPSITVYRSPSCGCCGRWLDTLQAAGFEVDDRVVEDVDAVKQDLGVPDAVASCHTATVGGYQIEGHVPVAEIQRLLAEQPDVLGIAVPGMPVGSPGMESEDEPADPFAVVTFTRDGTVEVFQEY